MIVGTPKQDILLSEDLDDFIDPEPKLAMMSPAFSSVILVTLFPALIRKYPKHGPPFYQETYFSWSKGMLRDTSYLGWVGEWIGKIQNVQYLPKFTYHCEYDDIYDLK